MILRRISEHVRNQNWTAIAIEFGIVVVGVFLGIQIGNWNEARIDAERREQIVDALATNLGDAIAVHEGFVAEIDRGLADWQAAFERGERPVPFHYRIHGSDTAPDVWSTFEQMGLTDLFDPVTLFDLAFFYSELEGIGRKYIRYVTVVEDELLPAEIAGADAFYDADGRLRPRFRASMDRLREFRQETEIMTRWAECLVYRLDADRVFEQTCRRAGYRLDGMAERAPRSPRVDAASPAGQGADVLTPDGWGPLRIGMTRAEVVAAAGEDANPEAVGGPDPESCDQFRPSRAPDGLLAMIEKGVLTRISVGRDSEIATPEGIRVGDAGSTVLEAYGSRAHVEPHKYWQSPAVYVTVWRDSASFGHRRGIRYEIDEGNTVVHIHAGGPAIEYVEGCA